MYAPDNGFSKVFRNHARRQYVGSLVERLHLGENVFSGDRRSKKGALKIPETVLGIHKEVARNLNLPDFPVLDVDIDFY